MRDPVVLEEIDPIRVSIARVLSRKVVWLQNNTGRGRPSERKRTKDKEEIEIKINASDQGLKPSSAGTHLKELPLMEKLTRH